MQKATLTESKSSFITQMPRSHLILLKMRSVD